MKDHHPAFRSHCQEPNSHIMLPKPDNKQLLRGTRTQLRRQKANFQIVTPTNHRHLQNRRAFFIKDRLIVFGGMKSVIRQPFPSLGGECGWSHGYIKGIRKREKERSISPSQPFWHQFLAQSPSVLESHQKSPSQNLSTMSKALTNDPPNESPDKVSHHTPANQPLTAPTPKSPQYVSSRTARNLH
jgi:hypothetical protein